MNKRNITYYSSKCPSCYFGWSCKSVFLKKICNKKEKQKKAKEIDEAIIPHILSNPSVNLSAEYKPVIIIVNERKNIE